MSRQNLPSSHRRLPNTFLTQQSHPQQPTPTYHRPPVPISTSWTLPTHYQGPSINSPADSLGPSWLCQKKQKTRKCSSLCTILEIIVHAVYTRLLFGLPMLYTSRILKLSEQVDVSLAGVKKSVLISAHTQRNEQSFGFVGSSTFGSRAGPPLHGDLKDAWDSFIDSLMRDWKILNVMSIFLLSVIIGILQIQSAADDPSTRFSGLLSLICTFISVAFGCMYRMRFESMRDPRKAVEWTLAAQNTQTSTFWNVYILLAMPFVWLTWSILLFLVFFLSFIWNTPSSQSPPIVTVHILGPRIIISAVIALGLACFVAILTIFRRYGGVMDDTWSLRVNSWLSETVCSACQQRSSIESRHVNQ